MPLALICSYTSWTMPNKGTYLPNIWSERFIPVIPESQSKDVQELLNETDCTCICVDEYPANGQDWVETILMFLGEKFASNLFVAQTNGGPTRCEQDRLLASCKARYGIKSHTAALVKWEEVGFIYPPTGISYDRN